MYKEHTLSNVFLPRLRSGEVTKYKGQYTNVVEGNSSTQIKDLETYTRSELNEPVIWQYFQGQTIESNPEPSATN